MPLGILIVLVQIAFAVHAIKTGRDRYWVWIIIMVPVIGCALYFITQFGPEAANSQSARRAKKRLIGAIDPQRELRKRMDLLELSDTVENRMALAGECAEAGLYDEAISLLKHCLRGLHENDPDIMTLLARCEFDRGQPDRAVETLESLIEANPDYKSVDGHLLFARALEGMGSHDAACQEYDVLCRSYPGEEARVRYGLLLQRLGRTEQAAKLFREALVRARRAPSHYRKKEREWLKIAQANA